MNSLRKVDENHSNAARMPRTLCVVFYMGTKTKLKVQNLTNRYGNIDFVLKDRPTSFFLAWATPVPVKQEDLLSNSKNKILFISFI